MKRIVCLLTLLVSSLVSMAQAPEEIVAKMSEMMDAREKEGVYMIVDVKIPIIGTISSKTWIRDNKTRLEAKMLGELLITWEDGTTEWTYNVKRNTVEIKTLTLTGSDSDADLSMFSGIDEDYTVEIQKETDDAWYLLCKRRKEKKDGDIPKTITLVVAKETYMPISLRARSSGATLTMHDIAFGVPLEKVTFNPADYPDAKTIDKR